MGFTLRYGNESQYVAFTPQCGWFAHAPGLHYAILFFLPVVEISAICLNLWIIYLLVGGGESNKLLQQSQHVYVLGCSVTNVLCAIFGILGYWFDLYVFPCVYKGLLVCGVKNTFQQGGGFQIVFNVALICYDRYRLVTLGTGYNHKAEVPRAKWGLFLTGMASLLLFIVPEVTIPLITGNLFDPSTYTNTRCRFSQAQPVSLLGGLNFNHIIGVVMVIVPFLFIAYFTLATTYKLFISQRKATAHGNSQLADFRKLLRASGIMFAMVGALMIAWFPFGVGLLVTEVDPTAISYKTLMLLVVLLDIAPLLDPFAYALTLPKLRERARETIVGRIFMRMLTINIKKAVLDGRVSRNSSTPTAPSILPTTTKTQPQPFLKILQKNIFGRKNEVSADAVQYLDENL